jgi:hypothetical protein
MNPEELKIGLSLLEKEFEIELKTDDLEKLEAVLTNEIIRLMLYSSEKLWNILYRIDVNEKQVKDFFNSGEPKTIAPAISKLIINRMMQKAKTRLAYREGRI